MDVGVALALLYAVLLDAASIFSRRGLESGSFRALLGISLVVGALVFVQIAALTTASPTSRPSSSPVPPSWSSAEGSRGRGEAVPFMTAIADGPVGMDATRPRARRRTDELPPGPAGPRP